MPTATETPLAKTETTEISTDMTAQLKTQTDASLQAVTGKGFKDPEFEKSLQEAMDRDAGKLPAEPVVEPPPVAKQPDPAAQAEAATKAAELAAQQEELRKIQELAGDIPATLLGEKPPEKKVVLADDATRLAERQKFLDEQTKGLSPKASERFKAIEAKAWESEQTARKLAAEREAETSALKKQLDELAKKAATPPDTSEAEKLKKQIEEMDAIIKQRDLLEDPRFKAHFDGRIDSELEEMKKLVSADNADELAQLVLLPESKKRKERIKDMVDGLDDLDRIKVLRRIDNVDELKSARAKEIADWKNNRIHVEAKKLEDQKTQQEKDRLKLEATQKEAWSLGLNSITSPERGLEVFRKLEGDDAWNAKVDSRLATVQKVLASELRPDQLVEIAARSVAVDDYRKMFLAQRMLIQKLSTELASLKTVQPDAADDGGGAPSVDETSGMSFVQAAVHGAVKSGALKVS